MRNIFDSEKYTALEEILRDLRNSLGLFSRMRNLGNF